MSQDTQKHTVVVINSSNFLPTEFVIADHDGQTVNTDQYRRINTSQYHKNGKPIAAGDAIEALLKALESAYRIELPRKLQLSNESQSLEIYKTLLRIYADSRQTWKTEEVQAKENAIWPSEWELLRNLANIYAGNPEKDGEKALTADEKGKLRAVFAAMAEAGSISDSVFTQHVGLSIASVNAASGQKR